MVTIFASSPACRYETAVASVSRRTRLGAGGDEAERGVRLDLAGLEARP